MDEGLNQIGKRYYDWSAKHFFGLLAMSVLALSLYAFADTLKPRDAPPPPSAPPNTRAFLSLDFKTSPAALIRVSVACGALIID